MTNVIVRERSLHKNRNPMIMSGIIMNKTVFNVTGEKPYINHHPSTSFVSVTDWPRKFPQDCGSKDQQSPITVTLSQKTSLTKNLTLEDYDQPVGLLVENTGHGGKWLSDFLYFCGGVLSRLKGQEKTRSIKNERRQSKNAVESTQENKGLEPLDQTIQEIKRKKISYRQPLS